MSTQQSPPGPQDLAMLLLPFTDDAALAWEAWWNNATFHHSLMALAALLPSMIQGLLTASVTVDAAIQAEIKRVEATPHAPLLHVIENDLIRPD